VVGTFNFIIGSWTFIIGSGTLPQLSQFENANPRIHNKECRPESRERMPLRTMIKYWVPVLLWMGLIFWMSTGMFSWDNSYHFLEQILRSIRPKISHNTLVTINNGLRKTGHLTEYFISGMLVFRAFKAGSTAPRVSRWAILSFVFIVLLAASDEFHQSFVATRTASIFDVGIDTAGGLLAICVSMLRHYRMRRQG
jgi:VanZ family protein